MFCKNCGFIVVKVKDEWLHENRGKPAIDCYKEDCSFPEPELQECEVR